MHHNCLPHDDEQRPSHDGTPLPTFGDLKTALDKTPADPKAPREPRTWLINSLEEDDDGPAVFIDGPAAHRVEVIEKSAYDAEVRAHEKTTPDETGLSELKDWAKNEWLNPTDISFKCQSAREMFGDFVAAYDRACALAERACDVADKYKARLASAESENERLDKRAQLDVGYLTAERDRYKSALEFALSGLAMWRKYQSPGNIAEVEQRIREALGGTVTHSSQTKGND